MTIPIHKIDYDTLGGAPACDHSMPCAICWTRKAVLEMDKGRFQPCWDCQSKGWKTIKTKKSLWYRIFIGDES